MRAPLAAGLAGILSRVNKDVGRFESHARRILRGVRRRLKVGLAWVRRHPETYVALVLLVLLATLPGLLAAAALLVLLAGAFVSFRPAEMPSYSFGLPGVPDGPPRLSGVPRWSYLAVSAAAAAAAVVMTVLDAPWWAFAVLVVLAVLGWAVSANDRLRFLHRQRRVRRALTAYAPTTAIGFGGKSGGPWQLRMWEPYLLRSGERCVVINVHEKYIPMILEGADLSSPFIHLGDRRFDDLDALFVPSIRVVFYVQNAVRNASFMAHDRLTHVWLGHGDSDKAASVNARHALFDLLVVCGQAGIDRYARHGVHIDPEKFRILGRPQAAGIMAVRTPIAERDPKVVLYAPTWHGLDTGINFSSLEKGPTIIRALLDRGVTVIFRPHPLSYRWTNRRATIEEIQAILETDRAATGRQHVWGELADRTWSVVDCANHADALISDVSSVVSDFLQSEKPYAMTSMYGPVDEFRKEFSVAETGYVILGDLSNLDEALDNLLDADPMAEARSERKRYVLGDYVGEESPEAFAEFVRELVRAD